MKALVIERNVARFAASRLASTFGSGRGAGIGPLRLLDSEAPDLPGDDWFPLRPSLSGICGSDLATLDGHSSRYFEDMVSFPFVPGHEVVGVLEEGGVDHVGAPLAAGARAVIEPVLGCAPRHIRPLCPRCQQGTTGLCGNVAFGDLDPGLQTGYCADTGGGWSTAGMVAHASQIHSVPDDFSDRDAVMIEPTACAVHAALSASIGPDETVAIVGAGTLGLLVTAALHHLVRPTTTCTVIVGAKHPRQRVLAGELGADSVVPPNQLARAVRRRSGSLVLGGRLTEGADVVFDCVGTSESLTTSLAMVRPRGRVVLVGMPGRVAIDLAPLWHRELALIGAYAYGVESQHDTADHEPVPDGGPSAEAGQRRSFELAFDLVARAGLGSLVSAAYPLERFEEAIAHAGAAGRRGAVKVVFDLHQRSRPKRETSR
jgi:threonine dehydrogenase-like Zn-dependent dehydrogenase